MRTAGSTGAAAPLVVCLVLLGLGTRACAGVRAVPAPAGWTRIDEVDAVTLYRPASSGSATPELQARASIAASPARVYRVVSDYDHFAEFVPGVAESRTLYRDGAWRWVFQRLDLPWPVRDRSYVIRVHDGLDQARGFYHVAWQLDASATQRNARSSATVTPRLFRGSWALRPAASGETMATYTVRFDPGGAVPGWLTRFAVRRLLPAVFAAVRARAEGIRRPASSRHSGRGRD